MTNTQNWYARFTREEVATAAKIKKDYHEARLSFWQGKEDGVIAEIKANGLEIDDSVAPGYSNVQRGPQVMVRNDLQKDLAECRQKVNEHRAKVLKFRSWVEFLKAPAPYGSRMKGESSNTDLELDIDDYLLFFSPDGGLPTD